MEAVLYVTLLCCPQGLGKLGFQPGIALSIFLNEEFEQSVI